nr:hypothetical protein DGKKSRWO_DGKKSRWO_CDS_0088 [uncultured phage]CAI9752265.1 hypothetical protein CVNMHQAP_CVNMHQAP_CDS_0088 [uncultured phage]
MACCWRHTNYIMLVSKCQLAGTNALAISASSFDMFRYRREIDFMNIHKFSKTGATSLIRTGFM